MTISRRAFARYAVVLFSISLPSVVGAFAQASIWDGIYTKEQAERGRRTYLKECKECHGQDLGGGETAAGLVGRELIEFWSDVSVGDLFAETRDTMPEDNPGELSEQTYADVLAYLFQANEFPAGNEELPPDVDALLDVGISPEPPD